MIDLANISLQFGGNYLFENVNFKINSGDKISLVGANGTGKSSLLKIINGDLQPESGKLLKQKNISIGYLPQENVTHKNKSLLEEALSALSDLVKLREKEKEITNRLSQKISERSTNEFSGGWQMRIALAKILISQNDLLLMDEPTNHLDIDSLEWLINYLKSYQGALLIVSHDKHFINEITNKTL
ncbi:MAG: ATP-binding cassette domain-containing protein [Ignavibacteriaceae bacterium]